MGERGSEALEFEGKYSRFKALGHRIDFNGLRAAKEAKEQEQYQKRQKNKRGMEL